MDQGDYPAAQSRYEESLAIFREAGESWGTAMALFSLGRLAMHHGHDATARSRLEESLAMFRRAGDRWFVAQLLNSLGDVARAREEYPEAGRLYEESLGLFRASGSKGGVASLLHNLGHLAHRRGDVQRAVELFGESLALFRDLGDLRGVAECLVGAAGVAVSQGQPERAARLLGAAEALLDRIGARISASNQADRDRTLAAVRAGLDEATFAAAWEAGWASPPEQVAGAALWGMGLTADLERTEDAPGVSTPAAPDRQSSPLTRREREVAALVARGLTDRQIAETLAITGGTVGVHLSNIFGKLDLHSRAQLAVWAAEHRLLAARPD
jgi:DNA-binding CsgD family transcriptional regulator